MTQLAEVLTVGDYEKERSPDELYRWVRRKNDQLSRWAGSHRRTIADRKVKYQELSKGLPKKFLDEALPIGYFTKEFYEGREDVLFKLCSGTQAAYDAILTSRNQQLIKRIEVTYAVEGYKWGLQKELLIDKGGSPMEDNIIGVKNNKAKHQRTIEDIQTTNESHDVSKRFVDEKQRIKNATKNKTDKSCDPKEPYGANETLLIVTFDDVRFKSRCSEILEFKRREIDALTHNFEEIVLFGSCYNAFYR